LVIDRDTFELVKQTGSWISLSAYAAAETYTSPAFSLLELVFCIPAVTKASVSRLLWHPKLNQVRPAAAAARHWSMRTLIHAATVE